MDFSRGFGSDLLQLIAENGSSTRIAYRVTGFCSTKPRWNGWVFAKLFARMSDCVAIRRGHACKRAFRGLGRGQSRATKAHRGQHNASDRERGQGLGRTRGARRLVGKALMTVRARNQTKNTTCVFLCLGLVGGSGKRVCCGSGVARTGGTAPQHFHFQSKHR